MAFQSALDALGAIGRWEWDAATDRARVNGFVALLFNIDPDEAKDGLPLSAFVERVHPNDRENVFAQIRRCRSDGGAFLAEYRVISSDGQTRWVLDRGHFTIDHFGRPIRGAGILVDITRMRTLEGTFDDTEASSIEAPLDRAVDHAVNAQQAIDDLRDPELKVYVDALLMALGRKLARRETLGRLQHMN